MELRNLEAFIRVAETKSFSRSAESMGLTQPAVSKRIAALEGALATKLFDRIGRSAQLTEAGRSLFPRAKHIQAEISCVKEELSNYGKEPKGTLTLGVTPSLATNELSPILKEFCIDFPEVQINLQLGTTEELLDQMNSNSLELAICPLFDNSLTKIPDPLRTTKIWASESIIAVARNHPLATATQVTVDDLCESNAILPPLDSLASNAITDAIARGSTELRVVARASESSTMKSLATIEMGWACLPISQMDDSLVAIEVQGLNLNQSITLIRRHERTLTRAAEAIIGSLPIDIAANQNATPQLAGTHPTKGNMLSA